MKPLVLLLTLLSSTPPPDAETVNQQKVRDATDLCTRSGCKACGHFYYDRGYDFFGRTYVRQPVLVRYVKSDCEEVFEISEARAAVEREDAEIRKLYGVKP